jgi:outer membrane protein assembly factor BamA
LNRFSISAVAAVVLFALLAPLARSAQPAGEDALIVEDLRCRGNASTSCDFMLGYVYLKPGDELDEMEVRNAQLRLATLRVFDSVTIFLEKGSERGKAVIVIEVVEADPLATEWLIGASYRLSAFRSVTAGRLTHQNLFGAGKLADLSISTVQPLNGPSEKAYSAALRYADPQLLGSTRYFGIVGASYVDGEVSTRDGNFGDATVLRFGATLGRRVWDFSYLTVGYGYRARLDVRSGRWQNDGTFELEEDHSRHAIDVLYGWNSEDDLYFPTHGSSFHTGFGWNFGDDDEDNEFHLQFRKTWGLGDGFVSLKLGGDPSPEYRQTFSENQLFTVSYARPVAPGDFVRRGRWYIETGYNHGGFRAGGEAIHEFGLKLGLRLETQTLGLIDLYVLATQDANR